MRPACYPSIVYQQPTNMLSQATGAPVISRTETVRDAMPFPRGELLPIHTMLTPYTARQVSRP